MTDPSSQQPAYQPPAGDGPSGPRASFGRRFVAAIIDGILLGIPGGILYAINTTLGYVVQLLLTVAYLTYLEGSPSGQTVGKKAMGIRVIDFRTGGSIGYGRAFIRWIGRYVSAITMMSSVRGPCTPSTRSSSMSLVAEGPDTSVKGR